ncbi:NAD-dependent epimerase/dehydratase family protein [Burkholderia contaminans]|uniref:NAD-dependent epimerase/dehydratase family protein n=1 Tax=Burkholderia contaminans TaxID=488447 RepID=UPI0014545993|nr:NAD-dependent epimerase/dehydratase family protein [Burkholderia contaminans]MCA8154886.1 GDP-mannose 4,6-dehydratase [Burkholderia contaminans]VWD34274.1 GDP-6-deoxy-D-lyxo-4-hexulose reductase [Burkholderia contaminans]
MPKVLISGINGFTGRHLSVEFARRGYQIRGLAHTVSVGADSGVYECDLLDLRRLTQICESEQPDVVVHLAAVAFVAHDDVSAIYQTNIVGTRNLLSALVEAGCKPRSVIIASSANVYGNAVCEILDESADPAPANDYAVSKLGAEYATRLWMDRLPITIVRPFNYTGVGQSEKFLLPKIVAHFRNQASVIELGNLNVVRDFSDVRDVASVYARLAEGSFAGQSFNVCSGKGYSLDEILAMVREISGHQLEVRVNPSFVRAAEVHKLIGDNTRLRNAIGAVSAIALSDTIRWMLGKSA